VVDFGFPPYQLKARRVKTTTGENADEMLRLGARQRPLIFADAAWLAARRTALLDLENDII